MSKILAWFWVVSALLHVAASRRWCGSCSEKCKEKCPLFDPPNRTVLLPGPTRAHFYMCRFGVGILYKCARGTEFNPRRRVCDWPRRARAVACRRSPDYEGEGSGEEEEGSGDGGHVSLH